MSFRDRIAALPDGVWSIQLETHFQTPIPNDTCNPDLSMRGPRLREEERFRSLYTQIRPPIAGYNCAGQVFAGRRTTILDLGLIHRILDEDGFSDVTSLMAGDVVVYSDDDGPMHAARVARLDEQSVGLLETGGPTVTFTLVHSKFDDMSGEYEHRVDDQRWARWHVAWQAYRDRWRPPRKPEGWRAKIQLLG